eukprot:SAG31_NODE_1889_length_6986_cov_3.253666_5_plen_221_part_00
MWHVVAAHSTQQVQPRNYLLLACHLFNEGAQLTQMYRALAYQAAEAKAAAAAKGEPEPIGVLEDPGTMLGAGAAGVAVLGAVAAAKPVKGWISQSGALPKAVKQMATHPAGPLTIHFWAPTCKWLLSVSNLADIERPTNQISLAQQTGGSHCSLFLWCGPEQRNYLIYCAESFAIVALTATGVIWSRYSMVINPVNYNLFAVNVVLAISSGYHLWCACPR